MVQNKQKFNNINITALITCFILIMVFVFGCVQYAFASSAKYTVAEIVESCNVEHGAYVGYTYDFSGSTSSSIFSVASSTGKMCAYYYQTDIQTFVGLLSDEPFDAYQFTEFKKKHLWHVDKQSSDGFYGVESVGSKFNIFEFQTQLLTFSTKEDAVAYLTDGEINNPLFQPSVYDENIPTPKNLEIYFDRKLNKPFNLGELCNPLKIKWTIPEDSDYSDYTLDVQIDVNYNKLNSIGGIGTKPTVLQTGKVEFASCSATDKELNISSTYSGWTELSKKYQNSTWGLTGNYFDLWLRYEDSSGNYGNWVKVTINPDNSSTVVKSGFFDNGTNTTINKGYEEISGDSGEHVKGDYDNYYVNTLDDNISNNLTSLKNNYSNLVSFYKELFSFLPAEIWIILIGLVSTMVIIAIIKFVRG